MKLPLKALSINLKILTAVAFIFVIALIDYRLFVNEARKIEIFDEMNTQLSGIRVAVTKLEYSLDMFVVAKRLENTTVALIKSDVNDLNKSMSELMENPKYKNLARDNSLLKDGMAAISNDWQTTTSEISRLNERLSPDEIMLIHNSVDMHTIIINETADRLLAAIGENRAEIFNNAKGLALKSIAVFILMWLVAVLIFYKRALIPAEAASAVAGNISSGDLNCRFNESSGGFMGALARELNIMIESVNQRSIKSGKELLALSDANKERKLQLEAVGALSVSTGMAISQNEFFSAAISEVLRAGGADAAVIYIKEDGVLSLKAASGLDDHLLNEASIALRSASPGKQTVPAAGLYANIEKYPLEDLARPFKEGGYSSLLSVPVVYNKETVGWLFAAERPGKDLIGGSVPFFEAIASNIGVFAGNVSLFHKEYHLKRFFERILNQMPFGLAVFDRNGSCIMLNGTLKKFFCAEQDFNFIGAYTVFEDDVLKSQGLLTSIKKSYEGYITEFIINYDPGLITRYKFHGEPKRLKIKSIPLYDSGGEISHIALIYEYMPDAEHARGRSGEIA